MVKTKNRLRALSRVLFAAYIAFTLYFLFFSEFLGRTSVSETFRYNITLFKEIDRFWTYREQLGMGVVFANIFGNVLCFVPFGTFIPIASKNKLLKNPVIVVLIVFLFSLAVEISQLFLKVGAFDVDDLFLNTIGGVIGYIIYCILSIIFALYGKMRENK